MITDRNTWLDDAQCAGDRPERYATSNLDPLRRNQEARRLCVGCPVLAECARDALDTGATDVVRGGIPLPPRRDYRLHYYYRRLLEVAEGGIGREPDADSRQLEQFRLHHLEQFWLDARCHWCRRSLRPRSPGFGVLAARLWPERVAAANRHSCNTCWRTRRGVA